MARLPALDRGAKARASDIALLLPFVAA